MIGFAGQARLDRSRPLSVAFLSVIGAACAYFSVVFAFGSCFGAFRVLVLTPQYGETTALLVELPAILAISWLSCGLIVRRFHVADGLGSRLGMGGLAFVLLMTAELALSILGFDRTVSDFISRYGTANGLLGLSAQFAFALIPSIRTKW